MIALINIAITIRKPRGNPSSGNWANKTGISVAPVALKIKVARIERIEIPIITTAVMPKNGSNRTFLEFSPIGQL